jgi:cytochrome c peroxidase
MKKLLLLLLIITTVISCKKDDEGEVIDPNKQVITLALPKGFPYPNIPSDNQPTQYRIDLGKKLFFDPILSRDSTISCSSCHLQDKFFQDGLPKAVGIDSLIGIRNSPSLLNAAYLPYVFWDGGVPNLEQQVLAPIEAHFEMDFDVNMVVQRLKNNPDYVTMSYNAYEQEPSVYVLTRAIACFERTLFTGKSKFDDYQYYNDLSAYTASELNGHNIFFGEKGECFHCHGTYNFTDHSFKNNGLYLNYVDSGRARITTLNSDVGKFKVPSLRNIEMTAPYMHDGSMATLEEVVDHYNTGGKNHPNKSGLLVQLNLTQQEKTDLVNFLKALTDQP